MTGWQPPTRFVFCQACGDACDDSKYLTKHTRLNWEGDSNWTGRVFAIVATLTNNGYFGDLSKYLTKPLGSVQHVSYEWRNDHQRNQSLFDSYSLWLAMAEQSSRILARSLTVYALLGCL
jgi:hypothetical protein